MNALPPLDITTPLSGYRVETLDGCKLIFGAVPLSDFRHLAQLVDKKALLAPDISDRVGASLVMGLPEDLARLRARRLPISDQRRRDAHQAEHRGLPPSVAQWLREGERGLSSNALCSVIFGVPEQAGNSHPRDPDDFSRCKALIEVTHARPLVDKAQDLSPEWALIVRNWDALCLLYDQEFAALTADNRQMPMTYARMQALFKTVRPT